MTTSNYHVMATLLLRETGIRPGDNISPELTGSIAQAIEETLRCCDRRLQEAEQLRVTMRARYKEEISRLHELRRLDVATREQLQVSVMALLEHARTAPGGTVEVTLPLDPYSVMRLRFSPPKEEDRAS